MSKTVILNKIDATIKSLKEYSYGILHINTNNEKISIKAVANNLQSMKTSDHSVAKIIFTPIKTKPQTVLPFRVRFTTVGEGREGIPPIGIAIIGYNNYIL